MQSVPGGWEDVFSTSEGRDRLSRTKIPGGWIYRNVVWSAGSIGLSVGMVFVPDGTPSPIGEIRSNANRP